MKHEFHDRDDGLSHCKVCNGGEGSLPAECPRRKMTIDQEEGVQAGVLNYFNNAWFVRVPNPTKHVDLDLHPAYHGGGPIGSALMWLTAALECKTWGWDEHQYEAASAALQDATRLAAGFAHPVRIGVGDTRFEGWYSGEEISRDPSKAIKQNFRDCYAAGHEEGVRTWPRQWDEVTERDAFEDKVYERYLKVREKRRAAGLSIFMDSESDQPMSREEVFVRESGDYIAVAYQSAWVGWKLARGGM